MGEGQKLLDALSAKRVTFAEFIAAFWRLPEAEKQYILDARRDKDKPA